MSLLKPSSRLRRYRFSASQLRTFTGNMSCSCLKCGSLISSFINIFMHRHFGFMIFMNMQSSCSRNITLSCLMNLFVAVSISSTMIKVNCMSFSTFTIMNMVRMCIAIGLSTYVNMFVTYRFMMMSIWIDLSDSISPSSRTDSDSFINSIFTKILNLIIDIYFLQRVII